MKRQLKTRGFKKIYLLLGMCAVLIVVIGVIAFLDKTSPPQETSVVVSPDPVSSALPTPELEEEQPQTDKKYLEYDDQAAIKLEELVNNRPLLTDTDKVAKAKILTLFPAGTESGVLYQTETLIIDYTKTIDLFMVEILTPNLDDAKAEALIWFRAQGLSQEGVCTLPVMFYVNGGVVQSMEDVDRNFSPLAPGC